MSEHHQVDAIRRHRAGDGRASADLLDDCHHGVRRVARPYPASYFELGERSDESMTSLVHTVFTCLDRRVYGRFPFRQRTPFDAYAEDAMTDRETRWHSFDARLSVARETLRDQYAANLRQMPLLAERDALHRQVVEALRSECRTFPGRNPRYPRYGLASWPDGLRPIRGDWSADRVVRLLRARGGWSVPARCQLVLERRGAPMYPGEISALLQDAAVAPLAALPAEEHSGSTPNDAERLPVRRAAADLFMSLAEDDRRLLALLLQGAPYRVISERVPSLRNATAITRALGRICDRFLDGVIAAFELPDGSRPQLRPQQVAELLLPILVELPAVRAALDAEEDAA